MTQAYVPPTDFPDEQRPRNLVRVASVVIVLLTALVATASYFAGRSVRPGEDARARVAVAEPPADAAATAQAPVEPEPARPASPFLAFDLMQLHPSVAEAVRQARRVQDEAMTAALRGEAAARRARAGAPGTGVILMNGGDEYAGEVSGGRAEGAGVYTWANTQEDAYAGDFVDGVMNGLGVKRWTDGATHFGSRRNEARDGYGVFVDATGGGYEGAWSNGAPDGYGVAWSADGTVRSQGRWAGNTLVEAWVIPTPVPTTDPATGDPAGGDPAADPTGSEPAGAVTAAAPGAEALADGLGVDSSSVDGAAPDAADTDEVSATTADESGDENAGEGEAGEAIEPAGVEPAETVTP